MTVDKTKKAQYVFIQKMAAYFNIPRKHIEEACGYNSDPTPTILTFPTLPDNIYFPWKVLAVQVNTVNLDIFLNHKKFFDSEIYRYYSEGLHSYTYGVDFVLAVYLKGTIWIVKKGLVNGQAGFFIYNPQENEDNWYTVQKIGSFLGCHYPKEIE